MNQIVKICNVCGPLSEDQIYKNKKCKSCSKAYAIKYFNNHKKDRNIYSKEWKNKNKDKLKKYRENYKSKHHAHKNIKDREYGKKYYKKNREERNTISKNKKQKERDELHTIYLKMRLGRKFKMRASEVPLWMTEIQRPLLLIKRKIKEIKNDN